MPHVSIQDVYPAKAYYRPGELAHLRVHLFVSENAPFQGRIRARLFFLNNEVACEEEPVAGSGTGVSVYEIAMPVPPQRPRGYGVEVTLLDEHGYVMDRRWTALDVLNHWTESPRYGYMCDFSPARADIDEAMEWCLRYHINALQFYDWMYRHDTLLPPEDVYFDPLGRVLSRRTVQAMIAAAAKHRIAALAYVAVYGASVPFWREHRAWALHDEQGNPIPFGEDFLYIMNPAPGSPWTAHLLQEIVTAVREMGFHGVHLDQYGEPKEGFDMDGRPVDMARALARFVWATRAHLQEHGLPSTVVFNAVDNWPIDQVARAPQDLVYIELWPPHVHFRDLWALTVAARRKSGGKPVVLAAYMSPSHSYNVRLMNAIILASGGTHIELGEGGLMLADPYFPNHEPIEARLATILRRYYDFAVQYENILFLNTEDVTEEWSDCVEVDNVGVTYEGENDHVWILARQGEDVQVLHLINLVGLPSDEWTAPIQVAPDSLRNLRLRCYSSRPIQQIWMASPDFDTPEPRDLPFKRGFSQRGPFVEVLIPQLEWWNVIVLRN